MSLDKNTKILIVGLGLIGGSYAAALKEKGYFIGAVDIDKESLQYALKNGMIDEGADIPNEEFIGKYDLVVFSLYPKIFEEWIKKYGKMIKKGAVVTDVTGVKSTIVPNIQKLLEGRCEFVPAHPMAGKETSGIKNARSDMFRNANYIITPTEINSKQAIDLVKELGETLEFKNISFLTIEKHDEIIGYLSQLTHCIAVALMLCKNSEEMEKYTGDSFRDLTRIAKINDAMWSELFFMNKEELISQMELFENSFAKLKESIANDDCDTLRKMMRLSNERRKSFDKK